MRTIPDKMPNLGVAIRVARAQKFWKQEDLAHAANRHIANDYDRITRSAVAQWELGNKPIPDLKLKAIEAALLVEFSGTVPINNDRHWRRGVSPQHSGHYLDTKAGPVMLAAVTSRSTGNAKART